MLGGETQTCCFDARRCSNVVQDAATHCFDVRCSNGLRDAATRCNEARCSSVLRDAAGERPQLPRHAEEDPGPCVVQLHCQCAVISQPRPAVAEHFHGMFLAPQGKMAKAEPLTRCFDARRSDVLQDAATCCFEGDAATCCETQLRAALMRDAAMCCEAQHIAALMRDTATCCETQVRAAKAAADGGVRGEGRSWWRCERSEHTQRGMRCRSYWRAASSSREVQFRSRRRCSPSCPRGIHVLPSGGSKHSLQFPAVESVAATLQTTPLGLGAGAPQRWSVAAALAVAVWDHRQGHGGGTGEHGGQGLVARAGGPTAVLGGGPAVPWWGRFRGGSWGPQGGVAALCHLLAALHAPRPLPHICTTVESELPELSGI